MTMAIGMAISGAYAIAVRTNPCEYQDQYYRIGNTYYPAGIFGVQYACTTLPTYVCTYYRPNPFQPNYYQPCKTGFFIKLNF